MTESPTRRPAVTAFATALGGYALLGGFVSFLGWPLDVPRLTDWFHDDVSIQPNACVLMMLSGAAVILVQMRSWRAVMTLGALVGLGGALILLQYIVGADFGFNHQLLFGRAWGQNTTLTPGRVGPPASTSFTLTGIALVLLARTAVQPQHAHLRRFVPILGMAVCVIMAFSLLGYLFGAKEFYTIPWLTAIALQTASMLLAVGAGLILSVPEHQPMLLLCEQSGAGALARIGIPTLVTTIPLVLWIRVRAFEQGLYDVGTGRALGALMLVVATVAVLWIALLALRRHEQALRDASRRKDEFLAMLGHELRNPLSPIRSGLDILSMEWSGDHKTIDLMREQVEHLVRLVDDLLDVARIMRGRIELRKETVQLADLVTRSVTAVSETIEGRQQDLHVILPESPIWLHVDPVRFVQVIGNLLTNASKYNEVGGRIGLKADCHSGQATIRVHDTGIGVEPELLPNIFELFIQSGRALERAEGGLGIGLALVKQLIEMHGGTISAESAGVGHGSTFTVRLPAVEAPVEAPEPVEQQAAAHSLRVLVVDDNVGAATMFAMLLAKLGGHDVEVAHDGPSALDKVKQIQPDVVFLDIGLPGIDGHQVAKRIRQDLEFDAPHDLLLVALTGYGQKEDRQRSQEAGFDVHLVKPPSVSQVLAIFANPKLLRRICRPRPTPGGTLQFPSTVKATDTAPDSDASCAPCSS